MPCTILLSLFDHVVKGTQDGNHVVYESERECEKFTVHKRTLDLIINIETYSGFFLFFLPSFFHFFLIL